jgi:hypothetical protein
MGHDLAEELVAENDHVFETLRAVIRNRESIPGPRLGNLG